MIFDEDYPNLADVRDGIQKKFAEGGVVNGSKKKHRIVLEKGEWVMNKKSLQDRINGSYNGR